MEKLPPTITLTELTHHLYKARIDYHQWDSRTKTLKDLLEEVRTRTCELIPYVEADGHISLERHIVSVTIDICTLSASGELRRIEEAKRVVSGEERSLRTDHSINGKVGPDERPNSAAIRTFKEKLGLNLEVVIVDGKADESPVQTVKRFRGAMKRKRKCCLITKVFIYENENFSSESYPGLPTLRLFHLYLCTVPQKFLRYRLMRNHADKKIVYEWKSVLEKQACYMFEPRGHIRAFSGP